MCGERVWLVLVLASLAIFTNARPVDETSLKPESLAQTFVDSSFSPLINKLASTPPYTPSAKEQKAIPLEALNATANIQTATGNDKVINVFIYEDLPYPYDDYQTVQQHLDMDSVFGEAIAKDGQIILHNVPVRFTYESKLAEIVLYRVKHSSRKFRVTWDPANADLFIVPAGALARSFEGQWQMCERTKTDPNHLVNLLPHLNSATASSHVFIISQVIRDINSCEGWWSAPEGLLSKAVRVALEEPENAARDWYFRERGVHNFISAPYPSMIHWATNYDSDPAYAKSWRIQTHRTVLMGFLGSFDRQLYPTDALKTEGDPQAVRHYLKQACAEWGDKICRVQAPSYKLSPIIEQYHKPVDDTQKATDPVVIANGIRSAKQEAVFCLEPPGDTPSRKSIVESLLFGCIPVLFTPSQEALYEEFWGSWRSNSRVYIDGNELINGHRNLRLELEAIPPDRVKEMQWTIAENAHRMQYALDDVDGDGVDVLMSAVLRRAHANK